MRICVFEDTGVAAARAARADAARVRPALRRQHAAGAAAARLGAAEVGAWVRPELAELCRLDYPDLAVNDRPGSRDRAGQRPLAAAR